ncbi:hypothetical protein OS493_013418 [Desmophyllum pertusum]|uniref:Uncharacterized protein n=1 Tax=Desmophyllum pertusum TaxID=174260 RepID=A0A9W9YDK9_9CNID|nr:hypothetical protein OS493_013418 [Desmophyllum pertusum]
MKSVPRQVRNCETLLAPANGIITGDCYRTYESSCTFECLEGYELTGSATRTCTVTAGNLMDWSGTAVTCTVTVAEVTCPALPKAAVGMYVPATCDDGGSPYPTTCELRCPSGYHINYLPTSIISDQRTCELNGTWEYRASSPTCKDTEPPVCGNCPSDILIDNATLSNTRVNWERPHVLTTQENHPSSPLTNNLESLYVVPSSTEVLYIASDDGGNENKTCSFRITLKKKACVIFPPPKNGALACTGADGDSPYCSVRCHIDYDFAFHPAYLYWCQGAKWQFYIFPGQPPTSKLPWPDCAKTDTPTAAKMVSYPSFYFDGNCSDPNLQAEMKSNFTTFLRGPQFAPPFCLIKPECTPDNVKTFCGTTSAPARRRKRRSVRELWIQRAFNFAKMPANFNYH